MAVSLPSLISTPESPEEPEDILSSSLSFLYPTAAANQHGSPGGLIHYTSPPLKTITLYLSDPPGEEARLLFAHYVWNASVFLAEAIGDGKWFRALEADSRSRREDWSVRGEKVLELGAGTGLASLLSALSSATSTTTTDYPSPPLLSTLQQNLHTNLPAPLRPLVTTTGHKWGDLTSPFSRSHTHHFTRILAADTLWMASQHEALAGSMAHFLARERGSRVWVVAGFHTGRGRMRGFFDVVGKVGLGVERIWEVDVDGAERGWRAVREEEGVGEGARWVAVAVLGWAGEMSG